MALLIFASWDVPAFQMSQNATKVLALYGGRSEVSIALIREENLSKNMMRRRQEHFVGGEQSSSTVYVITEDCNSRCHSHTMSMMICSVVLVLVVLFLILRVACATMAMKSDA
jgi:hypothetical protein